MYCINVTQCDINLDSPRLETVFCVDWNLSERLSFIAQLNSGPLNCHLDCADCIANGGPYEHLVKKIEIMVSVATNHLLPITIN